MKKKIVIKVRVKCDKCRNKALKTAAGEKVSLQGEDKDQVAVTGEGVDAHCLVKTLKKKLGAADMLVAAFVAMAMSSKTSPRIALFGAIERACPCSQGTPKYSNSGIVEDFVFVIMKLWTVLGSLEPIPPRFFRYSLRLLCCNPKSILAFNSECLP
ncbi:hypothetical protein RJT34_10719 [Clitoria ternatea]|uniref:HMA domain-containing protein n=1 Tax=Clitoria ternatea TaxID=43366 RepID=A0AAN9JIK9_CLITE